MGFQAHGCDYAAASMARSFWHSAWWLLAAANLFWAGNIVLARGLAGQVPPISLAYWRWTGAFIVSIGFAWPALKTDLPVMLRHWKMMLVLSATGIASYNTMSYIGLTSTTALNVLLLQSATPLIIIVWAYLLFGETPTLRQAVGVLVSLGVAAIAGHGSLDVLAHLRLNRGDLWVLAGLLIYAFYCVGLRKRPAVHPLSFLAAAMGIGSVMMLPFMLGGRRGGEDSWRAVLLRGDRLHRHSAVVRCLPVVQPRRRVDRRRPGRTVDASDAAVRQHPGGRVPARGVPDLPRLRHRDDRDGHSAGLDQVGANAGDGSKPHHNVIWLRRPTA
jgi:drug/metabolite transporter (DMT)-like permease